MNAADARGRRLFFAIFTISGFSGLIYESIWSHYLKLFLGHAAYAQTLVLAIFMGGMAIGAWLTAKYSTRIRSLLIGYAIVEGVIGVLGLVFHGTSIAVTSWAFDTLLPGVEWPAMAQVAKWTLGAVLILPQSILLGATFPLMSGAVIRRFPEQPGETLAMLYFTNSLGAAAGVLVSGFVLVGLVGLPGTILTAGLLNILLALVVWGIYKYEPYVEHAALGAAAPGTDTSSTPLLRWMLIGAAVTGIAAFLYEIAWIRMLSMVLGSSTHSFELMLSAFILGIALGGLWVRKRIDALSDPLRFLSIILTVMAVIALLSLPIYNATFDLMAATVRTFAPTPQGYVGHHLASHSIAMLVMMPTTFFCGMTLPIMTNVLIRNGTGERAIGAVYAWNTAGAIVGVIAAVHLLMPYIGVKGIVIAGAALHLSLAVFFASRAGGSERLTLSVGRRAAVAVVALTVAILFFNLDAAKLSSGVFRHGSPRQEATSRILFLEHGKTASVSVVDVGGSVSIATNGKSDAAIRMDGDVSSQDEVTMVLAGALSAALHGNPAQVANIGIGSGLTSHVILADDRVQQLDTIEIEPLMARAAELAFVPRVQRTFKDPRSRIHFEDAKTFFALQRKQYDVIVSEPSNPWVSGVSTLFSGEFYHQITRYLKPDGILIQWVQTYETDMDVVLSVMKALAPQFGDFAIYSADDFNLLIVASRGKVPKPDARVFSTPEMRAELLRVGISDIQHIERRFLGDKRLLLPLLNSSGVPANSDYFPYVDLNASRARILKRAAGEYAGLHILSVPFFELLDGSASLRQRTLASPHVMSIQDQLVSGAVALRDAIGTMDYDRLSPQQTTALIVLGSKDGCPEPAVRRAWLDSAYVLVTETSVALSASELTPIWDHVGRTPCASSLVGGEREFFQLMRSIALRDVHSVAKDGAAWLASDYTFVRPDQIGWAMMATAASQIAVGQPAAAAELVRNSVERARPTESERFAMRWLSAIAVDRMRSAAEGGISEGGG